MGRERIANHHFICKNCEQPASHYDKRYTTFCSRECSFAYCKSQAKKWNCHECKMPTNRGTKFCVTCRKAQKKEKAIIRKFIAEMDNIRNQQEAQKEIQAIKEANREKRKLVIKNYFASFQADWSITRKPITLDRLIQRDKNICYLCGESCDKSDFAYRSGMFTVGKNYPSIDHIIARANGGTHTWDNIALAHHYCNSLKSDKKIKIVDGKQTIFL